MALLFLLTGLTWSCCQGQEKKIPYSRDFGLYLITRLYFKSYFERLRASEGLSTDFVKLSCKHWGNIRYLYWRVKPWKKKKIRGVDDCGPNLDSLDLWWLDNRRQWGLDDSLDGYSLTIRQLDNSHSRRLRFHWNLKDKSRHSCRNQYTVCSGLGVCLLH